MQLYTPRLTSLPLQNELRHQSPEGLIQLSRTPTTASLFLRALKNPGTFFRPIEIYGALVEMSVELPQLRLLQTNDLLDFLHPLLLWLEYCGVQTTIQVEGKSRCDTCKSATSSSSVLGGICFLPPPGGANETVSSLLSRAYRQSQNAEPCTTCGSTLEIEEVLNSPDMLTLSLPRALPDGSVLEDPGESTNSLHTHRRTK